MKNDQVMPNLMFMCQSDIWPILCQLMAILAKLLDMDFKFVLPYIYINFDIQTNFEVKLAILSQKKLNNTPKKSLKWPYLKIPFCPRVIHQKAYSSYICQ